MNEKKIVILGAGITGLTAAWELSKTCPGRVVLLERAEEVGGLAATFTRKNESFDLGSHRLSLDIGSHRFHEKYDRRVFQIIRELCGNNLLKRERKGLIYLNGRYLKYPPSALEILTAFGPREFFRFLRDFLKARFFKGLPASRENFESYTVAKIGRSLYECFYKPYAVKLWNLPPDQIASRPAEARVRKFSLVALWHEFFRLFAKTETDYFYYPSQGIGQLSHELKKRFTENRGRLLCNTRIERMEVSADQKMAALTFTDETGQAETLQVETVISCIPLDELHPLVRFPEENGNIPPFDLKWRALRILYLKTDGKIPSENETFYFPTAELRIGRVSEVNKYSPELNTDHGKSVLTIEIPCSVGDEVWHMEDASLTTHCLEELKKVRILRPETNGHSEYFSKRVKGVYPVYELGWDEKFKRIHERLHSVRNLYLIGRSALFLHCNIDHCMHMALRLADFLTQGSGDKADWKKIEHEFFNFKVRE